VTDVGATVFLLQRILCATLHRIVEQRQPVAHRANHQPGVVRSSNV
jgi:hypothetical protein